MMPRDHIGNTFKTAMEISLSEAPSNVPKVYRDRIGSSDQRDVYRLQLSKRSRIHLTLKGLKADVDLVLLNAQRQILKRSQRPGRRTEVLKTTLPSGKYYLQVQPAKHSISGISDTTYVLRVARIDSPDSNLPDLVGSHFKIPSTLNPGSRFTVDFSIRNNGTTTSQPVQVAFYLSGDRTITTGDRFLGQTEISPILANADTGALTQILTLPDTSTNFFWNRNGNHFIGIVIDPVHVISETNETNNANTGDNSDRSTLHVAAPLDSTSFQIQFDYRFDHTGWFTPERRATLEAAADIWKSLIHDEFTDISAGETFDLFDPQPVVTSISQINIHYEFNPVNATLTAPIDDLLIFVGAGNLGWSTFAQASATTGLPLSGELFTRWQGKDFQPYLGTITFNSAIDWFFDSTPATGDDVPSNEQDFLSIALHEIGHVLGISNTTKAFTDQIVNNSFMGKNAIAYNSGQSIPLQIDWSHIQNSALVNPTAELMTALIDNHRNLPSLLDLAILKDIGYEVI